MLWWQLPSYIVYQYSYVVMTTTQLHCLRVFLCCALLELGDILLRFMICVNINNRHVCLESGMMSGLNIVIQQCDTTASMHCDHLQQGDYIMALVPSCPALAEWLYDISILWQQLLSPTSAGVSMASANCAWLWRWDSRA